MPKFTQGKWKYKENAFGEISIRAINDDEICFISDYRPKEEQEANARLIAIAPAMYEFIKAVSEGFETEIEYWQMFDVAKQLLAKINGVEDNG